jgi:tight adherence protein C
MQELKNIFYNILENSDYLSILALFFVATVALSLALFFIIRARQAKPTQRIDKLVGKNKPMPSKGSSAKLLAREQPSLASRISKPLHRLSSLDQRSVKRKLLQKLVMAGYRSDQALYNYLASKIITPILFVVIYLFSRIYYKLETEALMAIALLILLGYFTPNAWVYLMTKARQEKIFKGLPDALDLMVVCVESGLGIDMTFKRVGDEIRPLCKELSDEFTLTNLEIRAGISREEAFNNMNSRIGVTEVSSLMTVLIQTSRFGTSLAKALRVHADAMRVKRRQIAEATAAKAAVKLIFPLVLFIFPAIFVVIIGPGAIKIIKYLLPALGGGG